MSGLNPLAALGLLFLMGCGLFPNDDSPDSQESSPRDDYQTVVGTEGLTLAAPGDEGVLVIPAGALTKSTTIGFQDVEPTKLADLPAGLRAVSRIYELTPHGLELEKSVDLKMPHTAMRTEDVQVLRLADASANTWTPILEGVVIGKSSVKLSIDHFSYYVVVEVEDPTGVATTGGDTGAGGFATGGTTGMAQVTCAGEVCMGAPGVADACCAGTSGECGFLWQGVCSALRKPDPRCPSAEGPLAETFASCCDESTNLCGIFNTLDETCVDLATAQPVAEQVGTLTLPSPVDCDGNPVSGTPAMPVASGCVGPNCVTNACGNGMIDQLFANNGIESCDNGPGSPQPCSDSTLACVVTGDFGESDLSYAAASGREVPVLTGATLRSGGFFTSVGELTYESQSMATLALDVEVMDNADGSWSNVVSTQTVAVPAGGSLRWRGGSVESTDIRIGAVQDDNGTWAALPTTQTLTLPTGATLRWAGGSVQGPASVELERRKDGNGMWRVVAAEQAITVASGAVLQLGQDSVTGPATVTVKPTMLADGTLSTPLVPQTLSVAGGVPVTIGDARITGPTDLVLEERTDSTGTTWTVLAAQSMTLAQGANAFLGNMAVRGPASVALDSAPRSAGGFGVTASQVTLGVNGALNGDIASLTGPVGVTVERRSERLLVAAQTLSLTGATSSAEFSRSVYNVLRGPATVTVEPRLLSSGQYQMVAPAQTLNLSGGGSLQWDDGRVTVSGDLDIAPNQEPSGAWQVLPIAQTVTLAAGDWLAWYACEQQSVTGPVQVDLTVVQNSLGTWQALPTAQTLNVGVGGELSPSSSFTQLLGPVTATLVRRTTTTGVTCALVQGRVDYGTCTSFPEYITYAVQQDAAGGWSSVASGAYCTADTQCTAYADCGTL